MPRISDKEMSERVEVLQDILENNPEGLSVAEMVVALKNRGVKLPKSEYQAVHIVLKNAQKEGVVVKEGNKWIPVAEDGESEVVF
jgi:hypothetical protein